MATKYIRRHAVFNVKSERQLRIWNWILENTSEFSDQNFADFVREKLEWCMLNENKQFKEVEVHQSYMVKPKAVDQEQKMGWKNLI